MTRIFMTLLAIALGATAAQADGHIADILGEAEAACTSFENGTFDAGDAVTMVDLDGDGTEDTIVDESRFACSSAASLYCGTGGCMVHALVGGTEGKWLAKGWKVVEWGEDRILLFAIHGANCGGTNLRRCYEAVVWNGEAFSTVAPKVE
ncbi:hypothetical protein [Oceanomicrobium pacificus]|uniref:Uncharacterized protein n=1 Tax=Oceanomicrobium pacificus TaxID=2692916 RepID=A0A6B0TQQ7_9RHOB|nr:hypothetical protein [Oceanomicrobium pacificus]MXU64125.1 hypothetical protein [Oceanomicrobium pacificus]